MQKFKVCPYVAGAATEFFTATLKLAMFIVVGVGGFARLVWNVQGLRRGV